MILMAMAANQLENITLLPVALDDHRGWVHLATNIGSNASLVSDEADQIARGYGTIVPSFRLDDLVEGPIDVVKVDVEGAEGRAMAGAGGLLEKWRPTVITEASEEMLQRVSKVSVKEYVEGFTRQGYTASLLDRNGGPPREIHDLEDFFAQWTDFLRVENLLLRPEERSGRTLEVVASGLRRPSRRCRRHFALPVERRPRCKDSARSTPGAIAMPHLAGLVGSTRWPLPEVDGTRWAAAGHTAAWGAPGRATSPMPL